MDKYISRELLFVELAELFAEAQEEDKRLSEMLCLSNDKVFIYSSKIVDIIDIFFPGYYEVFCEKLPLVASILKDDKEIARHCTSWVEVYDFIESLDEGDEYSFEEIDK